MFGNVKDTQVREDGTLIGPESEVDMFKMYPKVSRQVGEGGTRWKL